MGRYAFLNPWYSAAASAAPYFTTLTVDFKLALVEKLAVKVDVVIATVGYLPFNSWD